MLTLTLLAVCVLFVGASGHKFGGALYDILVEDCDPPEGIVGKFCATVLDDDVDDDGDADNRDFTSSILSNSRDSNLCRHEKWEVMTHWKCRYGWSDSYNNYTFEFLDDNNDGAFTAEDFSVPTRFSRNEFLMIQYTSFRDYCADPTHRKDPLDREHCAEVDTLTDADIKCPFL